MKVFDQLSLRGDIKNKENYKLRTLSKKGGGWGGEGGLALSEVLGDCKFVYFSSSHDK